MPCGRYSYTAAGAGGGEKKKIDVPPLDWDKLAARQVEPPFKPAGSGKGDDSNFDEEFTAEPAVLTPAEAERIEAIDQREFDGFTFVNALFKD